MKRPRILIAAGVALVLLVAGVVTAYAVTRPQTHSFFAEADVSGAVDDADNSPVELGLRFVSRAAGTLSAVRFLKASGDDGDHRVSVWSGQGERLATAVPDGESGSGWQEVELAAPVRVAPGQEYVVSYHTSRYRATPDYFAGGAAEAGPLSTVGAGVFAYGNGGFPEHTWKDTNYWVDVVFTATGDPVPDAVPSTGSSAPPAPSAAASVTPAPASAAPAAGLLSLPRVPWEGGPAYYARFRQAKASGYADPDFFPLGVWFESVLEDADVRRDKAAGLNTYVELTANSDPAVVRRGGMRAMISAQFPGRGDESIAWLLADEVDMWAGPGSGKWTGKYPGKGDICATKKACGYDVLRRVSDGYPKDGRLRYANFGKGVMFWESDEEAARFVNGYTDVISNDVYWYTDPGVCESPSEGQALGVKPQTCRRAANYGRTMDRMRELDAKDGKRQPVYAFVEVGHPFTEADAPTITGDQIAGAVMNSLIHEARGILYFNHNFGGPCISQHVLRDDCGKAVRPAVTEVNRRITSLARVLNTQSYAWRANPDLDTMLKAHDGFAYLFAMPGRAGGTGEQELTLPPGLTGSRAEVMFEDRTAPVEGGVIRDRFAAEHSYHVYKIKI